MRAALLVVDVQVDFCPGGALGVEHGGDVVPRLNRVIDTFGELGLPIFFTRDWHPSNHVSFKAQGGPWPPHCVQGSAGAEFHPDLRVPRDAVIVSKGESPSKEAYSGFQGTDLGTRLGKLKVVEVLVGGLATDYCVKETALDAIRAGFAVDVLEDCVKAVEAKPGDGDRALVEIREAGAKLLTSAKAAEGLASAQA